MLKWQSHGLVDSKFAFVHTYFVLKVGAIVSDSVACLFTTLEDSVCSYHVTLANSGILDSYHFAETFLCSM